MGQAEAKDLSEKYNKNPYYNIKKQGLLPFHDLTNQIYSEEEKFLLNSIDKLVKSKNLQLYNSRISMKIGEIVTLSLNDNVTILNLNYDISTVDLKKERKVCLYNIKSNYIYLGNDDLSHLVFKLKKIKYLDVLITKDNRDLIEELIFCRFIYLKDIDNKINFDFDTSKLIYNSNLVSFKIGQEDALEIEQFYYVAGTQMRINKFTYDILNLFDGSLSANDVYNLLKNEGIEIDYEIYYELITIALNSCIVNIYKH